MTLAFCTEGDPRNPALVMLHGFLGNTEDWSPVVSLLKQQFFCVAVDLPGHGGSAAVDAGSGFDDCCAQIDTTLKNIGIHSFWLAGYSLGGRVAMHYACCYQSDQSVSCEHPDTVQLSGLIVESAHPGLKHEPERQARKEHDHHWAERFRCEPLDVVLYDWYRQPVFACLSQDDQQIMVDQRRNNKGRTLADMLEATSLSRQACFHDALCRLPFPVLYICGDRDLKFQAIGQQFSECPTMTVHLQEQAGHNVHHACPTAYADTILSFYSSMTERN
ncbi:2-succinyl-6-hydroxy-2,4-cyclohexadiene-1-carboxylate synthase [Kistimonas asteriae]|uniref:2-succinyl-6-hydroxy-2, 4-cyclohexadiene-1-carboxylate synthase n=1 Tax=Kistimonas asteriae TaxID=517724 RepID=UPI001BA7F35E|nr:2-succinyl-6-hydroxy-2,4-cyclohexadiene-1-carboxylate synthase [Kistimonas asteriae]